MTLNKLPSVIERYKFDDHGLVKTDFGVWVPAYVGSSCGFNDAEWFYIENMFYPKLKTEAGVLPLCPFKACREFLGPQPSPDDPFRKHLKYWRRFNMQIIPEINYGILMPKAKFMVAILEGHHVDEGVAAEVSHFSTKGYGPIIGIRTDFRLAENMAANINGAVQYFIDGEPYNGKFICGHGAYDAAMKEIKTLADRIRGEAKQ